jgi:hypothetical protein
MFKTRTLYAGILFCAFLTGLNGAEYCSPDGRDATWYGLKGNALKAPKITFKDNSVTATAVAKGTYQGIACDLNKMIDIRKCSTLKFEIKQGFYYNRKAACVIRLEFEKSNIGPKYIYRSFNSGTGKWTPVAIALEPRAWKGFGKLAATFRNVKTIALYPYSALNSKEKYISLRNIQFVPREKTSKKILVNDYKYQVKPTSGDKHANILTDGVVDKNKQAYWRNYESAPEVIFDLGGIYLIDKIKIDAFAAPSHNMAEVTFLSSTDGKNWRPATAIENKAKGIKTKHQILQKDKLKVPGRYIKMLTRKERPDHMVYISEVSFYGRIPTESELRQTIASSYYIGPQMPPRNSAQYLRLDSEGIKLNICRKNSVINGLEYKGKMLAERIYDSYKLSYLKKDIEANSYNDKVIKTVKTDGKIILTTVNPKLPGITITKTFRINKGALVRKLKFSATGFNGKAFVTTASVVVLNKTFRSKGIYESSGASHSLERMFADEVIANVKATRQPTLSFEQPEEKITLFHYRYKFDNKFLYMDCVSEDDKSTMFTPTGWRVTSAVFQFRSNTQSSVTNRLAITEGNLYDAYLNYINLPEPENFRSTIKRPAWLRDIVVNSSLGWDGLWTGAGLRRLGRFVKMTRSGYIIEPAICDMDFIWGEFPTKGEVRNWFGGKQTPEQLRKTIKDLKNLAPERIKIGIYTWIWSAFPYSEPCREHPEWFVWKHRNGADASWFPNVNRNYLRFWDIKASRDDATKRIVEMMNYYKLDVWYLDGGNAGSYTRDWQTMRQDDPHAATILYETIRKKIKKTDPNRIVFFNAPCNPLGDLGFLESFSGVMTSKWRKGAAWMWKFKLWQVNDHLHYPLYIYWLPGVEGAYENYMVGLGLLPTYSSREMRAKDMPYLTARYENRMASLVNGYVKPDWRSNPNTMLECYSLKNGAAGIVFIKSHAKNIKKEQVSVLTAPLGLNQKLPVYSWVITVRNAKKWDGRFGEPELEKLYSSVQWAPDRVATVKFASPFKAEKRISREFTTVPDELKLWVTTNTPAFIWSTNGMRTQLWLPECPKLKLTGEIQANQITVNANSDFKTSEVALIIPKGKAPASISVNNRSRNFTLVRNADSLLAIVRISKGTNKIVATLKDVSAPSSNLKIAITGTSNAQKEIVIKAGSDWIGRTVCAKVELDGSTLWASSVKCSKNKFNLALRAPRSLRKGTYKVTVSDVSGKKRAETNWKVSGGRPEVVLPYGVLPHLPIKSQVSQKQYKVNGIAISASGIEYSQGAGNAIADPAKASVTAGMPPMYANHYNIAAAGLNLKAQRYLKIRITSNFEYFNRIGLKPGSHFVRHGRVACFAGMMLDFGTDKGFAVRSAVGFGKINTKKRDTMPNAWGTKKRPDRFFALNDYIHGNDKSITCWIDLHRLGAPATWDGSLWLTAQVQNLCPDRNMTITVLGTSNKLPAGAKVQSGHNLSDTGKKKVFVLKKSAAKVSLNSEWNSPELKNLPEHSDFSMLHNSFRKSTQQTKFKITRDDNNLYLTVFCQENEKKALNCEMGKVGKPWHSDSIEFFFTIGSGLDVVHAVIDADGNAYQALEGPNKVGGKKSKVAWITYKAKQYPGYWTITAVIPLENIQIKSPFKGQMIGFNVMRNRLKSSKVEHLSYVPGKTYFTGRQYQLNIK